MRFLKIINYLVLTFESLPYLFLVESVTENSRNHLVPLSTHPLLTADTENSGENEGDWDRYESLLLLNVRRQRGREEKMERQR